MKTDGGILRYLLPGGGPASKSDLLAFSVTGLGILAVSVVFNSYGLIHFEWVRYIAYHLGPGSVWEKIFDSRTLDNGVYAGRELSYLVDHLDVMLVALSVKWGCPLFISTTHIVLCVFIGVWVGWFAARDLGLGSLIGLLLALLFWTTPFVYLHFLMRTAKVLTAAALVILLVEIWRACIGKEDEKDARLRFRFVASITLAAWVLSFADRQGVYFLVLICGFMALQWGLGRTRAARSIFLLLLAVLALELVYFFWIAPSLTVAFFGYEPDFSFNRLPVEELLAKPAYFGAQALGVLIQTISFTLGRIPHWMVWLALAMSLGVSLGGDIKHRSWRRQIPLAGVIGVMLVGLWVMYGLMILRHPPLLWPDMQLTYYWIPTGALVILGVAGAWGGWVGQYPWRRTVSAGLLLALVGGNIAALPGHQAVFAAGHLGDSIRDSREIRYALLHHGDPRYTPPAEVDATPAYHSLLGYAPEAKYPEVPWDEFLYGSFYRATRSSSAPVRFIQRFGGNVDSRFLSFSAGFGAAEEGGNFLGVTSGRARMRVNLPSNRLRGELIVQRAGTESAGPLTVDFSIFVQPDANTRYERWANRVELPAGQKEIVVSYAIDSSHLPTLFTLDIPDAAAGKIVAGWRNPLITDIGGDSSVPAWLVRSGAPVTALDEAALGRLLPADWRPVQAQMRNGRVTEAGIELSPGGEIWLRAQYIVSKFTGVATAVPGVKPGSLAPISGLWYKAGRLQLYSPPMPENKTDGSMTFQAWCGEPGGWLVILADPNPVRLPVLVRVTEVKQEH